MQNILDAVRRYLTEKTDYALLINGKWGIGKTFHVRKHIFPIIGTMRTMNRGDERSYLPIYVSLFGVSTITALEGKILAETYSLLQGFASKKVIGFAKAASRDWLDAKGYGEIGKYLSELGLEKLPLKKYDDIVLCLDDFERKGEQLSIKELSGYINNLCDRFGIKIIALMNEEGFNNDESLSLKEIKEKVIGVQVDFIPDFKRSFDEITREMCASTPDYSSFLMNEFPLFNQLIKEADDNLRTLKYLIAHFKPVFEEVDQYCRDFPERVDVVDVMRTQLPTLLRFAFAITIEFRKGRISFSRREGLGPNMISKSLLAMMRLKNTDDKKPPSYSEAFYQQYFPGDNLKFFESIFGQVTGGPQFDLQLLLKELEYHFGITAGILPEHYKVLQLVTPPTVYTATNEDYSRLLDKLRTFAIAGCYKLEEYLLIFDLLTKYGNINKYNIPALVDDLKSGIDQSSSNQHINYNVGYARPALSNEYSEELNELRRHINRAYESQKAGIEKEYFTHLKSALFYNPRELHRAILENRTAESYEQRSFFSEIVLDDFLVAFDKYDTKKISDLVDFFSVRYYNRGLDFFFKEEEPFFREFSNQIDRRIVESKPSLQRGVLEDLRHQLGVILSKSEGTNQ